MIPLNSLTNNQKTELRNAFTLIDGDSKDSLITKEDLVKLYKTLGIQPPRKADLEVMVATDDKTSKGLNFAQFSNIMAQQLSKLDDRTTIHNALQVFAEGSDINDLIIDVDTLKEACCSVQLGEIGSGDNRLSRATFDELVRGFVKEQSNGKKLFLASNWLDAYID
ncbi:Myosin type II regulatory light chain [Yamadazyma tenuis]|uniref:EF-hand domain-containing protein n=1 Tax=Candida tenuis (strain ATCC 10573 / BCRC 21748 / CBS 615 / JCM 9827 / NBRC 10315 / NRRL Y-1498 / VKM Y-70) TaxID=590646 RepID=G3B2V7_CANTC|nr:uncharacterized protein CANTEDRAFT_103193 [Yamadazyma tenuis ATCC 10573]EGV64771.1 hypothetical protein CANTEDRAFT_103193 [Yamadazyma tenuis ATCC 10573]WEJ97564.1 Myosin type II regulatory light chain [Yamadazyma tenuis]